MAEQVFTNCTVGGPVLVHVKNGRITRVRPMVFGNKDGPTWTIEIDDKKYTPPPKAAVAPYVLTERTRVYSADRIKYPYKRVGFDPAGNRHPENRGKCQYERIGWDQALDIVAGEIKKIRATYGSAAMIAVHSSHHNWGNIGYYFSTFLRFFNLVGYRHDVTSPLSWEGWVWGAVHAHGHHWKLGTPEHNDLLEDALKNTDLIIYWSSDPDSANAIYSGHSSALWRLWLRERGIKQIFIDPYCNYTAAIHADKWIPIRPDTGAALAMAIAYVWIDEDTYDHDYVANRTYGFEEFKRYIIGDDDGVRKSPEWAEEKTGVQARVTRALAREWASKRTMLGAGSVAGLGGACRSAYAHEWARLMVLLMAMQGMGKAGVNMWSTATGAPLDTSFNFPGYSKLGINFLSKSGLPKNPVTQIVWRPLIPDAILNPPLHWRSEGFCAGSIEQQFTHHTYPEPGSPEIKMLYRYGGSFIGTGVETNKWVQLYQSPKLEFVVNQSIFWDPETSFADIILPVCTNFERNDISEWANADGFGKFIYNSGVSHRLIVYQQKAIEPLYESKSDYQIFAELAERLGMKEEFTEGNTEEDWIEKQFYTSSLPKYISFKEFKKKGYFVVPFPKDYKPAPAMRWFYEGRPCDTDDMNPKINTDKATELGTYSGKIEFVSQSLMAHEPDDDERPPLPRYIPSWEGHTSELAKKYPLQLITPHTRYSFNTQYDTHTPWLGDIPGNRILKEGYYWHTTRIHPVDAEARGIRNGDIIKLYNDRGAVLGIAQVTERVMPGVIHSYTASSKYDPVEAGTAGSVDRGGCVNLLTPSRLMSRNAPGAAWNSCLVEVTKWEV
jgi:molybdopterin guanine dinucleotide-containing S/N-oxide reductase-like protein